MTLIFARSVGSIGYIIKFRLRSARALLNFGRVPFERVRDTRLERQTDRRNLIENADRPVLQVAEELSPGNILAGHTHKLGKAH